MYQTNVLLLLNTNAGKGLFDLYLMVLTIFLKSYSHNGITYILMLLPILLAIAYLTLVERKLLAIIQSRRGPNMVYLFGLLQPIADAIKLITKEGILPRRADKYIYLISPVVFLTIALTNWGFLQIFFNIENTVLYFLLLSSLSVYGILLAGWSSGSLYAFLGGLRSAAQLISYELSFSFAIVIIILVTKTTNLQSILEFQKYIYNLLFFFPLAIIFFISMLAELSRPPFDLPEAEAELVSGYNVDYSSLSFAFYFIGEYSNIILMSTLFIILFWGGSQSYFFSTMMFFYYSVSTQVQHLISSNLHWNFFSFLFIVFRNIYIVTCILFLCIFSYFFLYGTFTKLYDIGEETEIWEKKLPLAMFLTFGAPFIGLLNILFLIFIRRFEHENLFKYLHKVLDSILPTAIQDINNLLYRTSVYTYAIFKFYLYLLVYMLTNIIYFFIQCVYSFSDKIQFAINNKLLLICILIFFSVKIVSMNAFIVFIRGIVPRYRYDQLMKLQWESILPNMIGIFFLIGSIYIFLFIEDAFFFVIILKDNLIKLFLQVKAFFYALIFMKIKLKILCIIFSFIFVLFIHFSFLNLYRDYIYSFIREEIAKNYFKDQSLIFFTMSKAIVVNSPVTVNIKDIPTLYDIMFAHDIVLMVLIVIVLYLEFIINTYFSLSFIVQSTYMIAKLPTLLSERFYYVIKWHESYKVPYDMRAALRSVMGSNWNKDWVEQYLHEIMKVIQILAEKKMYTVDLFFLQHYKHIQLLLFVIFYFFFGAYFIFKIDKIFFSIFLIFFFNLILFVLINKDYNTIFSIRCIENLPPTELLDKTTFIEKFTTFIEKFKAAFKRFFGSY
jgi:NADH-quinone oxidoreductase subunit H